MAERLDETVQKWLKRACEIATHHRNHDVQASHVHYAMLEDNFFDDFWDVTRSGTKGATLEILGDRIRGFEQNDAPTKPELTGPLRDVIGHSVAGQPLTPLRAETLSFNLVHQLPCLEGPIQSHLRSWTQSLATRVARSADLECVKHAALNKPDEEKSLSKSFAGIGERALFLRTDLAEQIVGQDAALDLVSRTAMIAAAGLERVNKTAGSFLFTGPTGVGKTETAMQIARSLGVPVHSLDMSEFMEKHDVSKAIGAPPGYLGYDKGGKLTNAVLKSPLSVVLIDEVEKAHPDVLNIFLQVMDKGRLTDGMGRTVDFGNAILVFTSNLGQGGPKEKNGLGFGAAATQLDATGDAVKGYFKPEFLNRLDGIAEFNDIRGQLLPLIVDKGIALFTEEMEKKHIRAEFSEAAIGHLKGKSQGVEFGPRGVFRIIEKDVKADIAVALLTKSLRPGMEIHIDFNREAEGKLAMTPRERDVVIPVSFDAAIPVSAPAPAIAAA